MSAAASLDALSPAEIAARLNGPPEQRAALIRAGAEAGVAEAQAIHAQMLLDGAGVPKDEKAAFRWFLSAAAQHHLMALNMVGRCYELGWGTRIDTVRAADCYRAAAENGLDWAMYNYATLLALGDGVEEDRPAAFAWFRRAADMGNAKAANHVGSFHEDGWAVDRDLCAAALWYAKAAEGGDFRGAFNHARMLGRQGRTDEALFWLKRAGEGGTTAFVAKAAAWLERSTIAAFRRAGVKALLEGAGRC